MGLGLCDLSERRPEFGAEVEQTFCHLDFLVEGNDSVGVVHDGLDEAFAIALEEKRFDLFPGAEELKLGDEGLEGEACVECL